MTKQELKAKYLAEKDKYYNDKEPYKSYSLSTSWFAYMDNLEKILNEYLGIKND